jgi:hypothetical protein
MKKYQPHTGTAESIGKTPHKEPYLPMKRAYNPLDRVFDPFMISSRLIGKLLV